ncbi:MAG: TetR/AcrR family transcriptional regulator [Candidatus Eiseniibacteriota bacterium]|nr:MAG: TetR/AcrR family transcriptional regulator [Candidatus Eisenbacteria bacterium]
MNGKTRREKERVARRKQILAAARVVFSRKGYHHSTLEEIARKAQLGKGTTYWYFSGKAELFLAVLEGVIDEQLLKVKQAASEKADCRSRIEGIAREQLEHFAKNQFLTRILSSEVVFKTQEMKRRMKRSIDERYAVYTELVEDVLREGISRREIRRVDVKKMSHVLLSVLHSLVYYWHIKEIKPRPAEDARMVCDLVFEGLER